MSYAAILMLKIFYPYILTRKRTRRTLNDANRSLPKLQESELLAGAALEQRQG